MPGLLDVGNIWKTLREIDLGPIREEAERVPWIGIIGSREGARQQLIQALCRDPRKNLPPGDASLSGPDPLSIDLAGARPDSRLDLIVLLLEDRDDAVAAAGLVRDWRAAGVKVVIVNNAATGGQIGATQFGDAVTLRGPLDESLLESHFVPVVLSALPDWHLALARYFPLFRSQVAQRLIADTCMVNANYSLTTGLAEMIPILDLPFNVADMIILTKNQAIMAYKLGLALGLSARWQEHMAAFGGTVGSGFVWRQLARQLVGLVPVWGLIPKVAVAYAGTYVLGQAIVQWYLTGRRVSPQMMRRYYKEAFDQGKQMAAGLLQRTPRPRRPALPGAPRLRLPARGTVICKYCGTRNPASNAFCGNCGKPLAAET